jgi:hypothetical protein
MWSIYGNSYDTDADFLNATKTVRFKVPAGNIQQYVRTWVIGNNDPLYTNITASIYADVNGSKGAKLYDSLTTHLKAAVSTKINFVKELYFEFDNLSLDENNWYHFALRGTSSGFTEDSHIAWKTSYPYPVYTTGLGSTNLAAYPYTFSMVGAEF